MTVYLFMSGKSVITVPARRKTKAMKAAKSLIGSSYKEKDCYGRYELVCSQMVGMNRYICCV